MARITLTNATLLAYVFDAKCQNSNGCFHPLRQADSQFDRLGRGAFKGQTSASTFLKDFGRRERRSKYQRDTRVAATHLGPRTSGWDDQPDLSDSEEDVRGRRYDDSDSDDGSPGPDGGLLAFASKDTAVTSRLREPESLKCFYNVNLHEPVGTWSWLPEGFVWDAFAVPEADITQPRQTRRGARESGAYIAAKTKMQVLIETAPTYTYDDWEDRDEREKIKKQARQRFDAETNELVDGEVADDEDEGRANLSSKRSKGRPDWQHLSRGSKKPLPPIYPIPAEDERQNRRKRIKVEHRIPEGADWRASRAAYPSCRFG